MKTFSLGSTTLQVPAISVGCMRIATMEHGDIRKLVDTAMSGGCNFFDHADIYGTNGRSEEVFAAALGMNPTLRKDMILQSKCGIRSGMFDFSTEHIISSVEGSLRRLGTDYLDILLLHRPDTLMQPEEVAEAFTRLEQDGKVKYFGVSNQNPMQIELLKTAVKQPLVANQLQFSIAHSGIVDAGINVNMRCDGAVNRDGGVLEYCRAKNITIQAWSPLQYGFFEGVFIDNDKFPELNAILGRIAQEQGVSKSAVAVAWILRHPANMQVVTGTTNPQRLGQMLSATEVSLTRQQWYEIYTADGRTLP